MDDLHRCPETEGRLKEFDLHWHVEDAVPFAQWSVNPNAARWQKRYEELHAIEIGLAIDAGNAVPACLLYRPPGAERYTPLGGFHRRVACEGLGRKEWPAYVIDAPMPEFLVELLAILDNVGGKKSYSLEQRMDLATHLLSFDDRDVATIAKYLQIKKPNTIREHADHLAALNRADVCKVTASAKKLRPRDLVAASKAFPHNDPVFRRAVEVLDFTGMQGNSAKGMIKDVQDAGSEARGIAHLDRLYEDHEKAIRKAEVLGKRVQTPTRAQRLRTGAIHFRNAFPKSKRVELLEIGHHDDDFVEGLEALMRDVLEIARMTAERCAELLKERQKVDA